MGAGLDQDADVSHGPSSVSVVPPPRGVPSEVEGMGEPSLADRARGHSGRALSSNGSNADAPLLPWNCPICGKGNDAGVALCVVCGRAPPKLKVASTPTSTSVSAKREKKGTWACHVCGKENVAGSPVLTWSCSICGRERRTEQKKGTPTSSAAPGEQQTGSDSGARVGGGAKGKDDRQELQRQAMDNDKIAAAVLAVQRDPAKMKDPAWMAELLKDPEVRDFFVKMRTTSTGQPPPAGLAHMPQGPAGGGNRGGGGLMPGAVQQTMPAIPNAFGSDVGAQPLPHHMGQPMIGPNGQPMMGQMSQPMLAPMGPMGQTGLVGQMGQPIPGQPQGFPPAQHTEQPAGQPNQPGQPDMISMLGQMPAMGGVAKILQRMPGLQGSLNQASLPGQTEYLSAQKWQQAHSQEIAAFQGAQAAQAAQAAGARVETVAASSGPPPSATGVPVEVQQLMGIPVQVWSPKAVLAWLSSTPHSAHAPAFEDLGVDGDLLSDFTEEDLFELGVSDAGERTALFGAIKTLPGMDGHAVVPSLAVPHQMPVAAPQQPVHMPLAAAAGSGTAGARALANANAAGGAGGAGGVGGTGGTGGGGSVSPEGSNGPGAAQQQQQQQQKPQAGEAGAWMGGMVDTRQENVDLAQDLLAFVRGIAAKKEEG